MKNYSRNVQIQGKSNKNFLVGDFNGDGLDDVIIWDSINRNWKIAINGHAGFNVNNISELNNWVIGGKWTCLSGDFNDDGKDDIVLWNPLSGEWKVALSNGKEFETDNGMADSINKKRWAIGDSCVPFVGDFNGDGKDDILVWFWKTGNWKVALSNGNEFIPDVGMGDGCWLKSWALWNGWLPFVGDFNGDGKDDIMVLDPTAGDWQVALSNGKGFIPDAGRGDYRWLSTRPSGNNWMRYIGDFNGDGKDDIMAIDNKTGEYQAAISSGNIFALQDKSKEKRINVNTKGKYILAGNFDNKKSDSIICVDICEDKSKLYTESIIIDKLILSISAEEQGNFHNNEISAVNMGCNSVGKRYTIVLLPSLNWNEPIFQRSHQLISEFARQGHFAIFTNLHNDGKGDFWLANENLCISNDLKATLCESSIRKKMKGTKTVLWVTLPDSIAYRDVVKSDIVVFDSIDEWVDEFASWKNKLKECMDTADIITTTSKRLFALINPQCPDKTYLIQNGADVRLYFTNDYILPKDLEALKNKYRYIIGFIGTIYTWIDFKFINDMAAERPDWGFVFIGPDYNSAMKQMRLSNIHYLGIRKYTELINYVKNFDAGLIPFQLRDMTQSVNPIKMYEYLAAGIPVISTAINECANLYPYVRIAATGKKAVEEIEEAINESKDEKDMYMRIAAENSWTCRVEDIIDIIDEYFKKD